MNDASRRHSGRWGHVCPALRRTTVSGDLLKIAQSSHADLRSRPFSRQRGASRFGIVLASVLYLMTAPIASGAVFGSLWTVPMSSPGSVFASPNGNVLAVGFGRGTPFPILQSVMPDSTPAWQVLDTLPSTKLGGA